MKLTLIGILLGLTAFTTYAQCDGCGPVAGERLDYCYKNPAFADKCAMFTDKATYFHLQNGKKSRKVAMPALTNVILGVATEADFVFKSLAALANDPKLKLTASDILFLTKAVEAWGTEARKYGYQTEASGLGIRILNEGTGPLPEVGKLVKVNYAGYLEDGKKFDSSFDRGEPIEFPLGQGRVIKGWDEGIAKLKIGTKAILKIPAELGYGARGAGGAIPPNATLYFIVEVVGQ
jgi:FKBP-type peptidyl-prolyl cis-trans isomerase